VVPHTREAQVFESFDEQALLIAYAYRDVDSDTEFTHGQPASGRASSDGLPVQSRTVLVTV